MEKDELHEMAYDAYMNQTISFAEHQKAYMQGFKDGYDSSQPGPMIISQYEEKFIVFHEKELKHLTDEGRANFSGIMKAIQLGRIHEGKRPLNNYYVCNQDEPYAEQVIKIILEGETEKLKAKKI